MGDKNYRTMVKHNKTAFVGMQAEYSLICTPDEGATLRGHYPSWEELVTLLGSVGQNPSQLTEIKNSLDQHGTCLLPELLLNDFDITRLGLE